jgi:sphingomyelin phosphodiesterase acid-like 3
MKWALAVVFIFACAIAGGQAEARVAPVLLLSDIHLNPLEDPSLAPALLREPVKKWGAILRSSAQPSSYGSDSNYPLWESSLSAMKARVPNPRLVVITGDFLSHGFEKSVARALPGSGEQELESLVDKTVALLAGELKAAFPHAELVTALGNNDSYCGDYTSEPGGAFLERFARAWRKAGASEFAQAGYSSVAAASFAGLRLITLNTTYWSSHFDDRCGSAVVDPSLGQAELRWLERELELARERKERVWILGHIPPGVDLFSTFYKTPDGCHGDLVSMYEPQLNQDYVALLGRYAGTVGLLLTGHTHKHEFRLVRNEGEPAIVDLGMSAVSAVYGNSPSFAELSVEADSLLIRDFRLFAYSASTLSWTLAYDFNRSYGLHGVSASSVAALHRLLGGTDANVAGTASEEARKKYAANFSAGSVRPDGTLRDWRLYECEATELDLARFKSCACAIH